MGRDFCGDCFFQRCNHHHQVYWPVCVFVPSATAGVWAAALLCDSLRATVTQGCTLTGAQSWWSWGQPGPAAAVSATGNSQHGSRGSSCLPCAPSTSVPALITELCLMQGVLEHEFTFTPLCRKIQVNATGTRQVLWHQTSAFLPPERTYWSVWCGLQILGWWKPFFRECFGLKLNL